MKLRGFTLIELMIVVTIIGIVAAIAIPNFVQFQVRTKQSEAKTNLKAIFTAQKIYYSENNGFATQGEVIGWGPEAANRYDYALGTGPVWNRPGPMPTTGYALVTHDTVRYPGTAMGPVSFSATASRGQTSGGPGVDGICPACDFTATAEANLDTDTALDQWIIGSWDGAVTGASGACAPPQPLVGAGNPTVVVDDGPCAN